MKYFVRNMYIPALLILGMFAGMKMYQESFTFIETYEDYLDWLCVQNVKRGHKIELLVRAMY